MFLFITAGATTELCAWEEGWDPWKNPVLQHMVFKVPWLGPV